MKLIFSFIIAVSLFACAAPRTTVQTDSQDGSVIFKVKPNSSVVYVDGKEVGKARDFTGRSAVLVLSAGTHHIVVKNGDLACEQTVYISDSQEVISCNLE